MATLSDSDETGSIPTKRIKKKLNGVKKKTKQQLALQQQPQEHQEPPAASPRKSLIRKRPVSFGNPALGTYHGCIYTLDVIGADYSPINAPIIEGAEQVDRVVAMVDVPPEQVPEGILNLARSHRPYLHHVRIVIAEHNNTSNTKKSNLSQDSQEVKIIDSNDNNQNKSEQAVSDAISISDSVVDEGGGQEETKDEIPCTSRHDNQNQVDQDNSSGGGDGDGDGGDAFQQHQHQSEKSVPQDATAVENAASILAADEERHLSPSKSGDFTADTNKETAKIEANEENDSASTRKPCISANGDNKEDTTADNNTDLGNESNQNINHNRDDSDSYNDNTNKEEEDDDGDENFSLPARTYVVLLELCSVDAAEEFVQDLHAKPYTSLDPSQKCSVFQVLALNGEDGVSLLSPFFAPSARSTSPKGTTTTTTTTTNATAVAKTSSTTVTEEELLNSSSTTNAATTTNAASVTASAILPAAPAPAIVEDYNCAVCLEHMILSETEEHDASDARSSILTTVCNHTFHLDCLLKWQDSPCPVCRYDHSGLNEALSQCNVCGTTENNYVCLICGVISCGGPPIRRSTSVMTRSRNNNANNSAAGVGGGNTNNRMTSYSPVCGASVMPPVVSHSSSNTAAFNNDSTLSPAEASRQLSQSHARKHYDETLHAYALDTETQHVWDFAGQGYVHRLLQNKEDGKLVEFNDPSNTSSHERSLSPGLSDAQEGEVLHRKLEGFASQYYTLLKSQLEQQRSYYQGRLEELRRESLTRKKAQTSDLIQALKQEKAQLSKRVISLKARHRKVVEDVAFLKNMNESLEANKEPLKRKIQEAQRQHIETRDQIQQCLPVLEEKVTMLMLKLTGEAITTEPSTNTVVAVAGVATAEAANNDVECAPSPTNNNPKTLDRSGSTQSDDCKPPAKH